MSVCHAVFLCPKFSSACKSLVGASLLAIAVHLLASMLNVLLQSRAGSLPLEEGVAKVCGKLAKPSCRSNTKVVWNLALSRIE